MILLVIPVLRLLLNATLSSISKSASDILFQLLKVAVPFAGLQGAFRSSVPWWPMSTLIFQARAMRVSQRHMRLLCRPYVPHFSCREAGQGLFCPRSKGGCVYF